MTLSPQKKKSSLDSKKVIHFNLTYRRTYLKKDYIFSSRTSNNISNLVEFSIRIRQLHLFRVVKTLYLQRVSCSNAKTFDSEDPVLEYWGMCNTLSLPLYDTK